MLYFPLCLAAATLTLEIRPTTLPNALAKLSEETGIRLEASPALGERIVMLKVNQADADQTLAKLADLQDAEWITRTDGTRVLRPDRAQERETAAILQKRADDVLKRSLDYVQAALRPQPGHYTSTFAAQIQQQQAKEEEARKQAEEAKNYEAMFRPSEAAEKMPGWRALGRVLLTLPTEDYLSMRWNGRLVWKEQPNRLQRAFNDSAKRALCAYREELAFFKPEAQVERVKVVLKRWELGVSHNAELIAYDGAGKIVDQAFIRLAADSDKLKIPLSKRNILPPALREEKVMRLSQTSEEFVKLFGEGASLPEEMRACWLPQLLNPESYEPTQWAQADLYFQVAAACGANFVGTPAEFADDPTGGRPMTPSQFLKRNERNLEFDADGWLVLRSELGLHAASRASAGRLLRRTHTLGGVTIDDAADFAAASDEVWPMLGWMSSYLKVITCAGGRHSYLRTTIDSTLLRFWASLGDSRSILRAGRPIDLSTLNPQAQTWLQVMLFDEERLSDIEPTEVFVNGVRGQLTIEVSSDVILQGSQSENAQLKSLSFSPEELGRALAVGNSYLEIPAETFQSLNQFRIGQENTLKLKFQFGNGIPDLEEGITESFFRDLSVRDLPTDLKERVQRAREQAAKGR